MDIDQQPKRKQQQQQKQPSGTRAISPADSSADVEEDGGSAGRSRSSRWTARCSDSSEWKRGEAQARARQARWAQARAKC